MDKVWQKLNSVKFNEHMKRIVLHTKDVMIITGKSERYSRELIRKMKEHFLKEKHQYVTIKEFSDYLGLDFDEVEKLII